MKKLFLSFLLFGTCAFAQDDSTMIDLNVARNSLANIFDNRYYTQSKPINITPDGSFIDYVQIITTELYQTTYQQIVTSGLCTFKKGGSGTVILNNPIPSTFKPCPNDSIFTVINRVLKKNQM